jgi:hypothetical protein
MCPEYVNFVGMYLKLLALPLYVSLFREPLD